MRPNVAPGPLTLLPVARSPSRPRHRAPLVGSYPTLSPLTRCLAGGEQRAGLLSVAVVVTAQLLTPCPHLLFREATLPIHKDRQGVGKFLYPLKAGSDGSPRWLLIS
jgi:hypothetical protein